MRGGSQDRAHRCQAGKTLSDKVCANNPVAKEYALGQQFNLTGTPTIILGNGELVPGYMPPADLAKELKDVAG